MSIKLDIQNLSALDSIPQQQQFQQWSAQTILDKDAELSLRIVDEAEGAELNKTWRKKDYATNVLSFPVGEQIEQAPNLLGDIVICAPLVEREAAEQGKDILAHWAHLFVHGILHLQGYDHESERDAEIMEAEEIRILNTLGYQNPYEHEQDQ